MASRAATRDDPLRVLVTSLQQARAGELAEERAVARVERALRAAAREGASKTPEERKFLRDQYLESVNPLVQDGALLSAVRDGQGLGSLGFSVLERVLSNVAAGGDGAALAFDRFLLGRHALSALRARSVFFARELRRRWRGDDDSTFRVMAFGGGPAIELLAFLRELGPAARGVRAIVVDGDPETASYVRNRALREGFHAAVEVRVEEPAQLALMDAADGLHDQDFVYCPTLLDFTPDEVVKRALEYLYRRVAPGGTLMVAHYHRDLTPLDRLALEWWLGWFPYFRTPKEIALLLKATCAGADGAAAGAVRGPNVYVQVTRS